MSVPYGDGESLPDAVSWSDLLAEAGPPAPLEFDPVPFDHPLYVLFSSGTTGLPKAIVHGHGGQLIEHHKNQGIIWDLKPGGRLLWFSTTAWMMWNALVSALLLRASIVMLDGDPAWPDLLQQWRLAEELRPTVMGVSPPFLMACRKAGLMPGRDLDLSSIRILCTAGSPLPAEGYRLRLRAHVARDHAAERLGRDGHVHRAGRRAAWRSRSTRARSRAPRSESTRTRSTPTATR